MDDQFSMEATPTTTSQHPTRPEMSKRRGSKHLSGNHGMADFPGVFFQSTDIYIIMFLTA